MLESLKQRDFKALQHCIAELYELGDLEQFKGRIVRALAPVVAGDIAIYAEIDIVLGAGQSATVGTVDCGCRNSPSGCNGSCGVRAAVATSVGPIQGDATWTFSVPGPCP